MENLKTLPTVTCRFGMKKMEMTDDQWNELRRKMAEGRKESFSKGVYARAIKAHCLECSGSRSDCGVTEHECFLQPVNAAPKRRSTTKGKIRKIVRNECINCTGSHEDICVSATCSLYPVRFGKKKPDVEAM